MSQDSANRVDVNVYNQLIDSIELHRVSMVELHVVRHPDALRDHESVEIKTHFGTKHKVIDGSQLNVMARISIIGSTKESQRELFRIETVYQLVYTVEFEESAEQFDKEYYDYFCKRNVYINVWPYIRELVNSLTMRMGLPPLVLPTLKIKPL